jgi:hypothetical protein
MALGALYSEERMMFQRNQPPIERKIAMAFVSVLEWVSMNLEHSLSASLHGESKKTDPG